MNRKINSLFIIAILFSMQAFLLLHVTKYGVEKHEHSDQVCDICLSADHNKLLSTSPAKLITPNLLTFKTILSKEILPFSSKIQLSEARAPPFFF